MLPYFGAPLKRRPTLRRMSTPLARQLADWSRTITVDDLPADVLAATKLRVLDVIGLAIAGSQTDFGRSTRQGAVALSPRGPATIVATGDRVAASYAAFANAALAQALEFDDTHNESIVHMSSPAVAAALALAQTRRITGREALTAIAIGNEISCRVGVVAKGQLHRRGFHPTGLFAPFGVTYLTGRLLDLDAEAMSRAAGICGSMAAGLLECWVDGTQSKFLHSGFAAQNGIAAATLAQAGVTGPPTIFEGRFGLFASHVQAPHKGAPYEESDFVRVTADLGTTWESRNASFKPYPAAHVLHPYVDAILRVRARDGVTPSDVERIDCPVAEFNVSIVCEPQSEKLKPASDSHARISLQYTLAEALYRGSLGRDAYSDAHRRHPEILALAERVHYHVDPKFPGPGRFKGEVRITLRDGRTITETQEHNLGSRENPMTAAQLRDKFTDNAGTVLGAERCARLANVIDRFDELDDVSAVIEATVAESKDAGVHV